MDFIVTPSRLRDARVTVPGDKSISHRALMLGSIATGRTEVTGFLAGEDCLATAAAMRALGVEISQPAPTEMLIEGAGLHGLQAPANDLDLGNSGTAMRLMAGLLAAQGFDSVLTGVSGRNELKSVLAKLESKQQALIFGHAVPMPVVVRTREYGSAESYQDFVPSQETDQEIEELWG